MYNKVKLSKRQIKEDKFTTFMLSSKHFASENWQFVVIGVVVVVLAIVGIGYFVNSKSNQKTDASNLFSRAMLDLRNGNSQVAVLGFSKVVEEYEGAKVAEQSTYLLGTINLELRNYSEAQRYFELYLSKYKEDIFKRASALAGLGTVYENQGDYANAADYFEKAFTEYEDGPLNGDYLLSSMRNYLDTDNQSKAKQWLEEIKNLFGGTALETRAIRIFNEKEKS